MKIAIIGPGAIGGLMAAYLKAKGEEVSVVGHANSVSEIEKKGLTISGVRGSLNIKIEISHKLSRIPDLAILSTKTQDLEDAVKDNLDFLKSPRVLTTQNGIKAEEIVARYLPQENIVSSIVMFGATSLEPSKIIHNFEGDLIIGRSFSKNDEGIAKIEEVLQKAFAVVITEEIKGMKYLKLFVNANNCLAAILGKSMQEIFIDPRVSAVAIGIWKEGLDIINKAGIKLVSLPDFPLERLNKLVSLPTAQAARIYTGIMSSLSKEPIYGSILQSIKRGRNSEIDYINGEFVRLAEEVNSKAILNEKVVELVHRVEKDGRFFSKDELLNFTKGLAD